MGNETNMENWAARERLKLIERAVWWRGWIGRPDLVEIFGISAAQASSDLQKYQELNPGALVYQMSRKRYEGAETMRCLLQEPRLEEAMAAFLGERVAVEAQGEVPGAGRVATVSPPRRKVDAHVERRIFLAVATGQKLEVNYHSVRSGGGETRVIVPRAFGHDGLRWHVRAWCGRNQCWLDFVLGRMASAGWPEAVTEELPADADWETFEELEYRVNPGLAEGQRQALEMDYGVDGKGILRIRCRKAMRQYVEAMLRVPPSGKRLPGHFVPSSSTEGSGE